MAKRKRSMTARQRQAFYRKAVWWDGEKLVRGLQNSTPEVADAYLAMIAKQGVEIRARGERILVAFQAEEERQAEDAGPRRGWGFRFYAPEIGPGTFHDATPIAHEGETLAEKIERATRILYARSPRR